MKHLDKQERYLLTATAGWLILGALACLNFLTGCMVTASTPSGIREFYRGQTGLVVTGKARPNEMDEYNKTERFTEQQKTLRIQIGGQDDSAE